MLIDSDVLTHITLISNKQYINRTIWVRYLILTKNLCNKCKPVARE